MQGECWKQLASGKAEMLKFSSWTVQENARKFPPKMKNVLGGWTGTQRLIVHKQSNVLMYERLGLTDEHVQLERQLKNKQSSWRACDRHNGQRAMQVSSLLVVSWLVVNLLVARLGVRLVVSSLKWCKKTISKHLKHDAKMQTIVIYVFGEGTSDWE